VGYNLFLDDVRCPKDLGGDYAALSWEVVRSFEQFRAVIMAKGMPSLCSFDYDLTPDWRDKGTKSGAACADWLRRHCVSTGERLPGWLVHSANREGRKKIEEILTTFENRWNA